MNKAEFHHPQEVPTYLQYPIDERIAGAPGKPIQNPELAERMAYTQAPYMELVEGAQNLGLSDIQNRILLAAKKAIAAEEATYYKEFGTTKEQAKLDRQFSSGEYQQSLERLEDLRGATQVFNIEGGDSTWSTRISHTRPLGALVKVQEEKIAELAVNPDLASRYRWKVERTLNKLFNNARYRRIIAGELSQGTPEFETATQSVKSVWVGVTTEVKDLLEAISAAGVDGRLNTQGINRVFGQYDLARHGVEQLSQIIDSIAPDGSNIVALSSSLDNPPEKYSAMLQAYKQFEGQKQQAKEEAIRQRQLKKAQAELARATLKIQQLSQSHTPTVGL